MFNSTVLDVAVSLIFVFLLFSLLCSALKEIIAGYLNLRGRMLIKGITSLLDGQVFQFALPSGLTGHFGVAGKLSAALKDRQALVADFFNHPLIVAQSTARMFSTKLRKPSYISDTDFSLALLSVLFGSTEAGNYSMASLRTLLRDADLNPAASKALLDFLNQTDRGFPTFRENIQDWYNDTMDRVSGWYKRQSQLILYALAALVVLGFNIDTVKVADRIYHDGPLRDAIVASASKPLPQAIVINQQGANSASSVSNPAAHPPSTTPIDSSWKEFKAVNDRISELKLPIGWTCKSFQNIPWWRTPFWNKLVGLILSIFALGLGAPFWFDALNKIMNLRAGGPKPEKSVG